MIGNGQTLRGGVQARVLKRFSEGHWEPGARISIDGLARELGVSPTPVREALIGMESSGLVEYRSRRGYVVATPLNPEQIGALIDARQVIERAALDRAFERGWESLRDELVAAHAAQSEASRRLRQNRDSDYARFILYVNADANFHDVFFRCAENDFLASMRDSLGAHIHRMRQTWEAGAAAMDAEEALAEHSEILRRVDEHNHDGALEALRQHLDNVLFRSGGVSFARLTDQR